MPQLLADHGFASHHSSIVSAFFVLFPVGFHSKRETVHSLKLISIEDLSHLSIFAELTKTLDEFNQSSCRELHDKMACSALEQMNKSAQNTADYVTSWSNTFTQEHASYSTANDKSEESVFSEMYHSLIHSAALETLLQLENTYALAMDDAASKKESAIKAMEEK